MTCTRVPTPVSEELGRCSWPDLDCGRTGETSDRVGCGGKDAGDGQGKVRGLKKKTCSSKLEMKLKSN